jgi:Putative Ig domain
MQPYIWSITSGQLPAGVSLANSGAISGSPSAAGNYTFTVQVQDAIGQQISKSFSLAIAAVLTITTSSLPGGTTGLAYSSSLAATGGTAPYTWSIASGVLAPGLSVGTTTGQISGSPTTAGAYNVTMQAQDAAGRTASKTLSLTILAALSVNAASLPVGVVRVPYTAALTATGGVTPYAWSVISGQLPNGLTLSTSGNISGTPTIHGTYTLTAQVKDAQGTTASRSVTALISDPAPVTISNADLPSGSTGTSYGATLAASGGVPPYSWSIGSGTLPSGLQLDASAGTISGTPTTVGWSNSFSLQAQDAAGGTASLNYSIIIKPALDMYGGFAGQTCTATGFFHTQKIGNRWWLCTPVGNVFFMTSVGGMLAPSDGCDPTKGQCSNYSAIATAKYGNLDTSWGPQQNRRILSWGFDSVGQLSNGYVYPGATCSGCAGWPNGQQPVKMPDSRTILVSNYSSRNLRNYAARPAKDIFGGLNQYYTDGNRQPGYRGAALVDFYDPMFRQWIKNYLGSDPGVAALLTPSQQPWHIGVFLDDTDWFWGIGAGSDFIPSTAGVNSGHPGYLNLITSPVQTFNPIPATGSNQEMYTDTRVYSKAAMDSPPSTCSTATPCSLRDYLYKRYNGDITALNTAWNTGGYYTTFDSSGTHRTEVIGKGDGSTARFIYTLSNPSASPASVAIKVDGVLVGGDCPYYLSTCGMPTGQGAFRSPSAPWTTNMSVDSAPTYIVDTNGNMQQATPTGQSLFTGSSAPTWNRTLGGTTSDGQVVWTNVGPGIAKGFTPWLSGLNFSADANYPPAAYWVTVRFHFGSTGFSENSRRVGDRGPTGQNKPAVIPPIDTTGGLATGYDVYMACQMNSGPAAFGCAGANDPYPALTLQATNVSFNVNWSPPAGGLVIGDAVPGPTSAITYASGALAIAFSRPPDNGSVITIEFDQNGWMYGTGVMDEDGRHTSWVGTNSTCVSARETPAAPGTRNYGCDGVNMPVPNANPTLGADLDQWISQLAGEYFSACRDGVKNAAPNLMYLGADTIGTWGTPPRREILQAAGTYVDGVFTSWRPDLVDSVNAQAMYQYFTRYLGDIPLLATGAEVANPDSSLWRYPYSAGATTQEGRGQRYLSWMTALLNTPSYNGTYPWVGMNWWGLVDFWNEKGNFGLVSLFDNPYDGKSATTAVRKDAWGFATGGEEKNYGNAIDYIKQANMLWYSLVNQQ